MPGSYNFDTLDQTSCLQRILSQTAGCDGRWRQLAHDVLSGAQGDDSRANSDRRSASSIPDAPHRLLSTRRLALAPILIVDDQPANIALLSALLTRAGYTNLHSTTRPSETFHLIDTVRPSLLLLDLRMPELDGFTVMQRLQELRPPDEYLPILVLTADNSPETKCRALADGAHDFLTKPFDPTEIQLRVTNLLRTQALYTDVQNQNETLERRVLERTEALERSRLETLQALALAAEFRDDETGQHARRVGEMAALIGQALQLPSDQVQLLRNAAPLHDIGKIGIPDSILLKPGRFTSDERTLMQTHPTIGFQIMEPCRSATLQMARQIALTHHERWDGSGYPHGLAGDLIPLPGRIVAAADAFDAMTHNRPYQAARSVADALAAFKRERGRQFDPDVADAIHLAVSAT